MYVGHLTSLSYLNAEILNLLFNIYILVYTQHFSKTSFYPWIKTYKLSPVRSVTRRVVIVITFGKFVDLDKLLFIFFVRSIKMYK